MTDVRPQPLQPLSPREEGVNVEHRLNDDREKDGIRRVLHQVSALQRRLPEHRRRLSEVPRVHVDGAAETLSIHTQYGRNRVDLTVAALLLVYLHGKIGSALSNQMRQTKSMSPQYAERWWDEHDLDPPDVDPVAFMKARLSWRYAKGTPRGLSGRMYLGNSIEKLERLRQAIEDGSRAKANLLFTSPPYRAITNYHYDQWLRLWLLGGPPNALLNGNGRGGKFEGRDSYRRLLECVFAGAARVLEDDATVYVRIAGSLRTVPRS